MNYEITCHLCKHLLSSPVILSCCSNSICSGCLSAISYNKEFSSESTCYNCPFCKKEAEEVHSATSNNFLACFLEHVNNSEKTLDLPCERCEKPTKTENIVICNECNNQNLCRNCSDSIHSIGRFQKHERTPFTKGVAHQAKCITGLMTCKTHVKERIEYICLKDTALLCNFCTLNHKQSCKNNVIPIKEAYKELHTQLVLKAEKINPYKALLTRDLSELNSSIEENDRNCERSKEIIQDQFTQLHSILEYKQKEVELSLDYLTVKRKRAIEEDIQAIENFELWIESIKSVIAFASSYKNSSFIQGAKYMSNRIDTLLGSLSGRKMTSMDQMLPPYLSNVEDCKSTLQKIFLILPTDKPVNEPQRSKVSTPRASTSRCNTPKTTKLARSNTPGEKSPPPNSRSTEPAKTQRSGISSTTNGKSQLDFALNKISFVNLPERNESKEVSSKMQLNTFTDSVDSPKFSNTQSVCSVSQRGQDEEEDSGMNIIKIQKKPSRISTGPPTTLANCGSATGAESERRNNLSTSLARSMESKKKKLSMNEIKYSNVSPSDTKDNEDSSFDVNHLTELQKNPLIKRMFTKISQTATTIFVSWTHPFSNTNVSYQVEYGIGAKVKGQEQFRTVFKGPSHTCIISDLMPKTTYRIRVCPILWKSKENGEEDGLQNKEKHETYGQYSEVINITTKPNQTIDPETLGHHAKMIPRAGDKLLIEFDKSGTLIATNGYSYGRVAWEVVLQQQSAHQSTDDSTSYVRIGIIQKGVKNATVIGRMINYGLSSHSVTIKVVLDLVNKTLMIQSSNVTAKEVINNLPDGTLFPAFQNKTNKNSGSSVKLFVHFDMVL